MADDRRIPQDCGSIDTAARAWVVHLHSGEATEQSRAAFDAWLAHSPAHVRAYSRHEQLMSDISAVGDVLMSAEPARGAGRMREASLRSGRAGAFSLALVTASALFLVALGFSLRPAPDAGGEGLFALFRPPVVQTDTAEIRSIMLSDGSSVTLGARSRIRTEFSESLRKITLLEGEAFFDVASDPARPFYVLAGDRMVRVVGTRFDVRRIDDSLRVAVVEGVVEVLPAIEPRVAEQVRLSTPREVLRAGEQVVALTGRPDVERSDVRPEMAAVWRRGWLAFEDASLAEILADANRYTETPIELSAPELGDIRITAAFGADGIDAFLEGLEASHGVVADRADARRIVLRLAM